MRREVSLGVLYAVRRGFVPLARYAQARGWMFIILCNLQGSWSPDKSVMQGKDTQKPLPPQSGKSPVNFHCCSYCGGALFFSAFSISSWVGSRGGGILLNVPQVLAYLPTPPHTIPVVSFFIQP
jgi:hypothetical protein